MTDDTPAGQDEAAQPAEEAATEAGDSAAADAEGNAPSAGDAVEHAVGSPTETPSAGATGATGETPDAGTAAEPATVAAAASAAPAASAASPPPHERRGVFVPIWLALLVAVLLVGGIGFAIGYAAADGDDSNSTNAAAVQPGQQNPDRGSGTLPGGGYVPGNGNGSNGNSGSNGSNGSGSQNATPTAFLGVSVESAANNGGARINNVRPGSPAADAGLQSGDVVTKIGDTTVQDDADLIRAVQSHDPGDQVTITYTRDGKSAEVKVELGDRSDATRSALPS